MDNKLGRTRGVLAALPALALLAVGFAHGAKVTTKSKTAVLPPDSESHSAVAKCPKAAKVTGGGILVGDADEDLIGGSQPTGGRRWTGNASRSNAHVDESTFTVFAVCLKDAGATTHATTRALPGDENPYSVTTKCPRGTKLVGGGIQLGDPGSERVLGMFPSGKREWTAVANRGQAGDSELTAVARCADGVKVKRRSETGPLLDDGVPHSVTAKCPKRTRTLGGGAEPGPTAGSVRGSYPIGKRRWTAVGRVIAPGDIELTAHVLCLKKPKKK
jgi:hypothetical protein